MTETTVGGRPTLVGEPATTVLPGLQPSGAVVALAATETTALSAPFQGGTIVLTAKQVPAAEQMLAGLNFATSKGSEIVQLGSTQEIAFNRVLDGFLARLNKSSAAPMFDLLGRLKKNVDQADLPKLFEKVENARPGFLARVFGKLRGKTAGQLASEAAEKFRNVLSSHTQSLADVMKGMEAELASEIRRLVEEMRQLDLLKVEYRQQIGEFAVVAAVGQAYLVKARTYVTEREGQLANDKSLEAQTEIADLRTKLTMLESRALALEGVYSRLPADQEVIRQIESAGVTTLGEVLTTAASRFASIKMTLLTLHGVLAVKTLQNSTTQLQQLDNQLLAMRGQAINQASVAAARAPGANRLAQANQIKAIVEETKALYVAVEAAKVESSNDFAAARAMFETARNEMQQLAAAHQPTNVSPV